MIELTPEARQQLDQYLNEVGTYLRACPSIDAEEVHRDIMEHIETELAEHAQPVDAKPLTAVLERLGSPRQWIPEAELPWLRKIVFRLHKGPEDWRLAYLSFAMLIPGVMILGPLGILGSFLLSRAAIAMTPNTKKLDARKWLLYPSLILVYIPIALFLLFWPVLLAGFTPPAYRATFGSLATGAWLIVCGLSANKLAPLLQRIFYPFVGVFEGRLRKKLIFVGAILVVLSVLVTVLFSATS
ncbi:MAG: HAAS signaling domain-containing protein [Planctomycetota bacterium]|jgi:hypothetical protein